MALPHHWRKVSGGQTHESGQAWVHQVHRAGKADGGHYAIKVLKNTKRTRRFEREIETMQRLADAGIAVPPVIEADLEAARPYVVTPWYAEGSLESRVVDRSFVSDPAGGLDYLLRVAAAINEIHQAGFAHRDLKPANVLIQGLEILIADFGLVLPVDELGERWTSMEEGVGSRFYIAPENESGINPEVDQRPADYYAYGKVIYALLAGRQPRSGMGQLDEGHRLEQVTGNLGLKDLAALQHDLLNSDPRARLQEWQVVMRELKNARDGLRTDEEGFDSSPELLELVRNAARRYGASSPALAFNRDHRRRQEHAQRVSEVRGALSRGLGEWSGQANDLNERLGSSVTVNCSTGGLKLTEALNIGPIRLAMQAWNPPFYPSELSSLSDLHESCPALFVISSNLSPANEAVYLAAFPLVLEMSVWLLRMPVLVSGELHYAKDAPSGLLDRFGDLIGPIRLGLASTVAVAEEFGRKTGEQGMILLTEFLNDPVRGLPGGPRH